MNDGQGSKRVSVCKSEGKKKVTNRWLRRQRQKFFLLFLGDHLGTRKLLFRFRFSGWLHLAAPAAGSSFSAGSLQSSCPGFAVVEFCYSALSRPDQAICYSLLTDRSSRDENEMKGTFFESSTSARRSMLMVSGITLLFLPVCSRKRVSISIGVPVRQHPPARLTQGFTGLQKALQSYRGLCRVTGCFTGLQRTFQGYRGLYRVTGCFTGLQRALQGYRGLFRVTEGFTELLRALQGYRVLYRVTEGFTGLPGAFQGYRGLYRVTGGFAGLQGALQGYRGLYLWSYGGISRFF